ncbi:MAG: hypothetical protein HWN65_16775 [Candidatus Helarchaeota archaeon]|nr:hypothetical protein [Candidatus Helarchaeota archaeon]
MSKRKISGILLLFIFLGSIFFIFGMGNGNVQVNQDVLRNGNGNLNSSAINVTSPGDMALDVGDSTNSTISWNLTDVGPYNYRGIYSFTEDTVGSNPNGWTVSEGASTYCDVIASNTNHRKVVELWDDNSAGAPGGIVTVDDAFPDQVAGTVEFWVRANYRSNTQFNLLLKEGSSDSINFIIRKDSGTNWIGIYLTYTEPFSEDTWYHVRLGFDCNTDTVNYWLNGDYKGEFSFNLPATGIDTVTIQTSGPFAYNNCRVWVDAIDYSWAPGYYTNRNMDVGPVDYLGTYSFTDDVVGSDPAGWTTIEPAGSNVEVSAEKDLHRNVVNLTFVSSSPAAEQIFGSRTPGDGSEIELWIYGETGSRMDIDIQNTGPGPGSYIWMQLRFGENTFYNVYNGGATSENLSGLAENFWHHLRIRPMTSNSFRIWLNGVELGPVSGTFMNPATYTRIFINNNPGTVYFDAVDYSWDSGYYPNRNMYFGLMDYAGAFSFTDDLTGADPNGWVVTESVNTKLEVHAEKAGRNRVAYLEMDNAATPQSCVMENNPWAVPQTAGTVEFWINIHEIPVWNAGGDPICFQVSGIGSNLGYLFAFFESGNAIQYGVGLPTWTDTGATWTADVWQHYRVVFNCTTDTYDLFQDGIQIGDDLSFRFVQASLSGDQFGYGWPQANNMNGSVWIDAVDYSWAPGYYLHRNMESTPYEAVDYLGVYSFTEDADGSDPANWNVFEGPTCAITVISEKESHKKVLEGYDGGTVSGQYWQLEDTFSNQAMGTIEYFIQTSDSSKYFRMYLYEGVSTVIYMNLDSGNLNYDDGSPHVICPISNDMFYHLKIDWNGFGWQVKVDETQYGSGYSYGFRIAPISGINRTHFSTASVDGDYYHYLDAIDFSWAPGYYPNRNMDVGPVDYLGTYSFTEDVDGSDPAGFVITEPANSSVQVINEVDGHGKVVRVETTGGTSPDFLNNFADQSMGETYWECWVRGSSGRARIVTQRDDWPNKKSWLSFNYNLNELRSVTLSGASSELISPISPNTWYHIRVQENLNNKLKVWLNGEYKGEFNSYDPQATINQIRIGIYTTSGLCWYDAVDYSWAPGYYPNRNMDYLGELIYAVFENGTRQTEWQDWTGQTQVDYNVSGAGLGVGVHNISLVFNDWDGNWYHDDVIVTVTSGVNEMPNITGVTQDPTSPSYQENVNVTAHVTDDFQVQTVYLESNYTGSLWNYSMTLLSGTQQDGFWNYTITNWPGNRTIAYRIFAIDNGGLSNSSTQYSFGFFDVLEPNIVSVTQVPLAPTYQEAVNVSVRVTDGTQVQAVYLQSNHTGIQTDYSMNLISGTLQDGVWNYVISNYLENSTIVYQILARDVLGNTNTSAQSSFGFFDILEPNIVNVTQVPLAPTYQEAVNVSVRVTDNTQVQAVTIQSNHSGTPTDYSMNLISGTQQDGVWNYVISNYLENSTIVYQILARDALGNTNTSGQFSFGFFDVDEPNIVSVTQIPGVPAYQDIVNVTVRVTDGTEIQSVYIETNYTGVLTTYPMIQVNGTLRDGFWEFSFNSYPLNRDIVYRIYARDALGNTNNSGQNSFGVYDLVDPNIFSYDQDPPVVTILESINITTRVIENLELVSVQLESNHTGSLVNHTMDLLSGTLQDGFWNYTIANWPVNVTIRYRIFATDVAGRTAVTSYTTFGIFPITSYYIPIAVDLEITIGDDQECTISFIFENQGNTKLLDLNFTVSILPPGWTSEPYERYFAELDPSERVTVIFDITGSGIEEDFEYPVVIDFKATIYETGQDITHQIFVIIAGITMWDITLWIIVIVGSVAAVATASFVVIQKRRAAGPKPKPKSFEVLKATMGKNFPGTYSIISGELMERIKSIEGLTDEERELLIRDVMQLDQEEAKKWLDGFEQSLAN